MQIEELTVKEKTFLLSLVQDHARSINEAVWMDETLMDELRMATNLFIKFQREIDEGT